MIREKLFLSRCINLAYSHYSSTSFRLIKFLQSSHGEQRNYPVTHGNLSSPPVSLRRSGSAVPPRSESSGNFRADNSPVTSADDSKTPSVERSMNSFYCDGLRSAFLVGAGRIASENLFQFASYRKVHGGNQST